MLQRVEKKVPELPVDFRIGVLNEALALDKSEVNKIQSQINDIVGDPLQTVKQLSSEIEELFKGSVIDNYDKIIAKGKELKNLQATFMSHSELFTSMSKKDKEDLFGLLAPKSGYISSMYESLLDQIKDSLGESKTIDIDNFVGIDLLNKFQEKLINAENQVKEF